MSVLGTQGKGKTLLLTVLADYWREKTKQQKNEKGVKN